jgi:hypothetical protein
MAAIEQAQLGFFERVHVVHQGHARAGQQVGIGRGSQVAFQHPFPEALGAQGCGIVPPQGGPGGGPMGFGGRRYDAVDHAVGKCAVAGHPVEQRRAVVTGACSLFAQSLKPAAVARQVVAAGQGQPGMAGGVPTGQPLDQQPSQFGTVPFFGHGQGYPAGGGCGQRAHHLLALLGRNGRAPQRTGHAPGGSSGTGHLDAVQAILGPQRLGQCRVAHGDPQHAPSPVAAAQEGVKHQGLVGPVKCPQTQMDHTGCRAWLGRQLHACRPLRGRPVQQGARQAGKLGRCPVSQTASLR